jgi:competence CoiA-like predicted nuclease
VKKTEGLLKRNYKPGWAINKKKYKKVKIKDTKEAHFKFYRQSGNGSVK